MLVVFKKISLWLFLLIFVSFAAEQFQEIFERPWNTEYKWPGNSSVVDYSLTFLFAPRWNVYITQASLDSLSLNSIETQLAKDEKIINARTNYSESKNICKQVDEFVDYGIVPFFFDVKGICEKSEIENCSCIITDQKLNCNFDINRDLRYSLATKLVSKRYGEVWKGTVNNALDALEASASALNKEIRTLENNYERINYTGICHADIADYKSCENASFLLNLIEGGGTAKDYLDFNVIKLALSNNTVRVHDDVPLLQFGWLINQIGNENQGAIGRIMKLNYNLDEYYNKTMKKYVVLSNEVNELLNNAGMAKQTANEHELWRIRVGPSFEGIVSDEVTSVNEKIKTGNVYFAGAYANQKSAPYTILYEKRGYLKDAFVNMTNAKELAIKANSEFNSAIKNAEDLSLVYEKKAYDWASKVKEKFGNNLWPNRAKALYDAATQSITYGKEERKLGRKFEHYADAIAYAKEAYTITQENEKDTNWTVVGICSKVSDLIKSAEIDKIDVSFEKAMFAVLNKSQNTSALIQGCENIFGNVVENAKYKYSNLETTGNEVVKLVALCEADCMDLKIALDRTEKGFVLNRRLVYPEVIGSLVKLQNTYENVKMDAIKSITQQINKYLTIRKYLFVEDVTLDVPTTAHLNVEVINTVDYPGENLQVEIESKIPFDDSNIVLGANNLRGAVYKLGKVSIYLKKINESSSVSFSFEKNQTILKTKTLNKSAVGLEDYTAQIREKRIVSSEAEINNFYVRYANDKCSEWKFLRINDIPVSIENNFVKSYISEGEHVFEAEYSYSETYSREILKNSSTKIGERTYQKYQVGLMPSIDMEYVKTFALIPQNSFVKEKRIVTITGEKIENVESEQGFAVRVFGLKKERWVKFEVSYYIDNSSEYADEEIKRLETLNLSEQTQQLVKNAKEAIAKNDTAGAIEKIFAAQEQINKEEAENSRLRVDYLEYYTLVSNELDKIEKVLGSNVDNEIVFVEKLSNRRDVLKELLNSLASMKLNDQVLRLKNYDKKWLPDQLKAFKKNASLEINKIYSEYLDQGIEDINLSLKLASLRTSYNKFDASNSLEDAYVLSIAIAETIRIFNKITEKSAAENANLIVKAGELNAEITELLKKYAREYADAKGTRFESTFKIKTSDVQTALKQLDAELKKNTVKTHDKVANYKEGIQSTLNYLENMARKNFIQLKESAAMVSGKLPEKDSKKVSVLLNASETHLENEEWIKALKTNDELSKIISSVEGNTDYTLVLWLSIIFVIGVIAIYYFKGKKNAWPPPPKILRKLEKAI